MSEAITTIRHSTIDIRHSKGSTIVIRPSSFHWVIIHSSIFIIHFQRCWKLKHQHGKPIVSRSILGDFRPMFLNHGVEIMDTKYRLTNLLKTNKFASSRVPGQISGSPKDLDNDRFQGFQKSLIYPIKKLWFFLDMVFSLFYSYFAATMQLRWTQ